MTKIQTSARIHMVSNGDNITAVLDSNKPLSQFKKIGTNSFMPDWKVAENQPTIIPRAFSQNSKKEVPIVIGSDKWLINNKEIIFDASGLSTTPKGVFQRVTVTENGVKIPALKIIDNLISESNTDNDTLECQCKVTVGTKTFDIYPMTDITLQETSGDPYTGYISATNAGVLTNDVNAVVCTAYLQRGGASMTQGVTVKWKKRENNTYVDIPSDVDKPFQRTFTRDDVDSNLIVMAEFLVNGVSVFATTRSISDITDPLDILMTIIAGGQPLQGETDQITYECKIIRRNTNIVIPNTQPFNFTLQKTDGTEIRKATGEQFTITGRDAVNAGANMLDLIVETIVDDKLM